MWIIGRETLREVVSNAHGRQLTVSRDIQVFFLLCKKRPWERCWVMTSFTQPNFDQIWWRKIFQLICIRNVWLLARFYYNLTWMSYQRHPGLLKDRHIHLMLLMFHYYQIKMVTLRYRKQVLKVLMKPCFRNAIVMVPLLSVTSTGNLITY